MLVVGVGAINNTFNTPGVVENCFFLKVEMRYTVLVLLTGVSAAAHQLLAIFVPCWRQEATDAMALRSRINECFELAALPHTTVEQRRKLLTFCVVRGGRTLAPSSRPTAVEVWGR